MKKLLCLLLMSTLLILALCGCTAPAMSNPDGSDTVAAVAVKTGLEVLEAALVTALTIAGTAWAAKMGKQAELKNINLATEHVIAIAKQTVGELKQTVVDGLKSESEDGKLTPEQIGALNHMLLEITLKKLDEPTKNLIAAAGADLCAIITGAAEDWISKGKIPVFPVFSDALIDDRDDEDPEDPDEGKPGNEDAGADVAASIAAGIEAATAAQDAPPAGAGAEPGAETQP